MKFGKRLKHQVEETLPEWRDKFLSYKNLKKLVRVISTSSPQLAYDGEAEFICVLNNEIEKFNSFFMEKEEDFIIRNKEMNYRVEKVKERCGSQPSITDYKEQMSNIRKDLVNFHGEMVLLINYSNINYTGLAKILKKYDKQTGGVLRLPFIQKVLEQPFFTTDLVSKLVRECEATLEAAAAEEEEVVELRSEEVTVAGEAIFRNTVAALLTMREIRRGSSTYGHFSLPPLDLQLLD
ncbi:hypothetical protein V2J09_015255 [Rumex salicifolius]